MLPRALVAREVADEVEVIRLRRVHQVAPGLGERGDDPVAVRPPHVAADPAAQNNLGDGRGQERDLSRYPRGRPPLSRDINAELRLRNAVITGNVPSASFRGELPVADVPTTYVAWTVYVPEEAKIVEKSLDGSLRNVPAPSNPIPAAAVHGVRKQQRAQQQAAQGQAAGGALGDGAVPVRVSLPLQGQGLHFEKLLAVDDVLWVGFDMKKLE